MTTHQVQLYMQKYCNPQPGVAQMLLWSVQASSQALAWMPQWWFAASPSGGLIRYCSLTFSPRIQYITMLIFVMFEGGYSLLVCAANGRSSDRLHGGIRDQVCMEGCPKESGQTLHRSPAGDLDWHSHGQRTQGHLRLCVMGSWWVCVGSVHLNLKEAWIHLKMKKGIFK